MTNLISFSIGCPKIVKTINLVNENDIFGFLKYLRDITPEYRLEEKNQRNIMDLYPYQEMYPNDEIDEILLNAVKDKYPRSILYNSLLIDQTDVDKLYASISYPFETADIIVKPDFSGISLYPGQSIPCFKKEITIYSDLSTKMIKNLGFWGQCNFQQSEEIYNRLDQIKFL